MSVFMMGISSLTKSTQVTGPVAVADCGKNI